MHHLVFGINFQIHPVSLTILVSIYLLIHLSAHLCHHLHSRHPSLLLSFTPGSKPTFSTNPSHRRFILPTGLRHDNGTGPDLSSSNPAWSYWSDATVLDDYAMTTTNSVRPSVRDVPVSDENGLTYRHSFFTIRYPNHASFISIKHLHEISTGSPPTSVINIGGI